MRPHPQRPKNRLHTPRSNQQHPQTPHHPNHRIRQTTRHRKNHPTPKRPPRSRTPRRQQRLQYPHRQRNQNPRISTPTPQNPTTNPPTHPPHHQNPAHRHNHKNRARTNHEKPRRQGRYRQHGGTPDSAQYPKRKQLVAPHPSLCRCYTRLVGVHGTTLPRPEETQEKETIMGTLSTQQKVENLRNSARRTKTTNQ